MHTATKIRQQGSSRKQFPHRYSLGIPGPTTCLQFLGIEIDMVANQLRLPEEKLQRLVSLLQGWGDRRSCSRKELESLVGHLNHACKVVRSGRIFLRRMLDLLHAVPHRPHSHGHIRLNAGFRSDLAWWKAFLAQWNRISYLPPPLSYCNLTCISRQMPLARGAVVHGMGRRGSK